MTYEIEIIVYCNVCGQKLETLKAAEFEKKRHPDAIVLRGYCPDCEEANNTEES